MANFTITVDGYTNLPPTEVGDGSATTDHAATIVYTRAMFTTNTIPPYSDPEGDAALNLKITSLPASGLLKLNGVNVTLNQILSFVDHIDAGLFTYVPDAGILAAYNTSFTFEISDAGSLTFVG
jgi:hypothetical protein